MFSNVVMLIPGRAVAARLLRCAAGASMLLLAASAVDAQADTLTRAIPRMVVVGPDSLRPPISPRRAFVYSLLAPGLGQSVLSRNKAATAFLFVEGVSLVMVRESAADVHEARRSANDTLVTSYVDASGNPVTSTTLPRFGNAEIKTRRAHVEDWLALLIANHLFAGADAFVAANLWDVRARLGMQLLPRGTALVASFTW